MLHEISRRTFLTGASVGAVASQARRLKAEIGGIDFPFIQLSDTHVSKHRLYSRHRGYDLPAEESIRRCRAAVNSINECSLPYELVVHTGDVAQTRNTNEDFDLARELLQFNKDDYYVPGNHDVGYSETAKYLPAFEKRFGVSNRSFEPVAGLRLALLDSQPLDPRASDADREKVFGHLDRILTPRRPTILFCHVMGLRPFFNNHLYPGWPETTMKRWIRRMKQGGVFAVLAGHFHRDEMHYVNGLPFYLIGPVINFWGRQTCYRQWRLRHGRLSYRTIYLDI